MNRCRGRAAAAAETGARGRLDRENGRAAADLKSGDGLVWRTTTRVHCQHTFSKSPGRSRRCCVGGRIVVSGAGRHRHCRGQLAVAGSWWWWWWCVESLRWNVVSALCPVAVPGPTRKFWAGHGLWCVWQLWQLSVAVPLVAGPSSPRSPQRRSGPACAKPALNRGNAIQCFLPCQACIGYLNLNHLRLSTQPLPLLAFTTRADIFPSSIFRREREIRCARHNANE